MKSKKRWVLVLKKVKKFMAYHLQYFICASVMHCQKLGETSNTTSLFLIQASGY